MRGRDDGDVSSRASVELAFYSLGTQHVTVSLPPEPVLS